MATLEWIFPAFVLCLCALAGGQDGETSLGLPDYEISGSSTAASSSVLSNLYSSHSHECGGHEEQWTRCEQMPDCDTCQPVDCMFSEWSDWWPGVGCIGLMFRHRSIAVPSNQCGLPCYGSGIESKRWFASECGGTPHDCLMSSWGEWSVCKNEKDQSIRKRIVQRPSSNDGEPCMGSTSETRPCGGPRPEPCIFDPWQSWTVCSASCGEGRFTRLRKIRSEGHLSGQTCESSLLETHTCQLRPCVSKDCLLSSWTDWSFCGAAGIQRMRHRSVLQSPEGLGLECNASLVQTSGCANKIPHHCEVTSWSDWSTCDRTCHGGQKFRARELLHGKSRRNFCAAIKLKQAAACSTRPCYSHSLDCELSHWTSWGACSSKVGVGVAHRKRTILRPAGLDADGCYGIMAELAACKLAPPRPIDCIWGVWSEWSGCSCSCGGGTKRRSRAIEMSPQNGGAPCQAKDKEVISVCNTMKCDTTCEDGYWGAWMDWTQCSATCSASYRSRRRSLEVRDDNLVN